MHYYQFHIGDYASHTRHLSLMEDLAYRRLLDFYYLHEQPIHQRDVARQIGMRDHEQDVLTVLNEFFVSSEDGFVSPRADKEISEYKTHQAKSAWGAFLRDHKALEPLTNKELFISKFIDGKHKEYIDTLIAHHVSLMGTSSTLDATTPTPTPTNHKPIKDKATVVACPPDVKEQVWKDWLTLRKMKKAPVTETVIESAQKEAIKANMSFNDFLVIWCRRGSQGLEADWLKPHEKQTFAQQAADIARTTVPAVNKGPDPALLKIEEDRKKATPMPDHIRKQIMSVVRKV